jgi:hypothetical protein
MAIAGGREPRAKLDRSSEHHYAGGSPFHRGHRWVRRVMARSAAFEAVRRLERRDVLTSSLLVAVVLLLILNVVTLLQLRRLEELTNQVLGPSVAADFQRFRSETFTYTVRIDQPLHVQTDFPIRRTIDVPINTTLPIQTNVTVPVNLGVSKFDLDIPIRASVPINMTVQAPISETVQIDTTVPIRADLPIAIRLDDTPLKPYLDQLERLLRQIQ